MSKSSKASKAPKLPNKPGLTKAQAKAEQAAENKRIKALKKVK